MPIEITVPRLGWSSEDGVFTGWLKQAGEKVVSGEPLFALESDKVTMEVESLDNGVLHMLPGGPEPGGVVVVGQLLGYLLAEGEEVEPLLSVRSPEGAPAQVVSPEPLAARQAAEGKPGTRRPVSPRARARAKSLGIDIDSVSPEAGSHRVVEADVLRFAGQREVAPPPVRTATSRTRKVIAARLEESFRTPHFYVHAEVDATGLARLRDELLPVLLEREGVRLSYNDLLVKAAALTLRSLPLVNCFWQQDEVVTLDTAHIGLAVQTDESLLVPVIRDPDRLSIHEIARARQSLVDKCRHSALKPADVEGASLTISNLGAFGIDRFQAILNPPQSIIVAAGSIARRPFVAGDAVLARLTLPLSVSVDHRVIDGVAAARFLQGLVRRLESPLGLVV
ncbi:MAG: 2-oxo acid dehydrogenase subunit E2 [Bryobacterales bacterium]|nr:2-oxo acid dehydrogenase subunit E2 [Bryobacterales bacterium]